jgi:hypothetical protein
MGLFENPLIANLIAFLIAVAAIFIFEWIKRPCLMVELYEGRHVDIIVAPEVRRLAARVVHLRAVNRPIWRSWIQRNTATNCRSRITITDTTGRRLHTDVATKWSARREPLVTTAVPFAPYLFQYPDDYLVGLCNRLDIYANRYGEAFAVAVKVDGDPNCYLFRGESYRSTNQWRLPEDIMPLGEFVVEVFVEAGNGRSKTVKYRLHNEGNTPQGLTLEAF